MERTGDYRLGFREAGLGRNNKGKTIRNQMSRVWKINNQIEKEQTDGRGQQHSKQGVQKPTKNCKTRRENFLTTSEGCWRSGEHHGSAWTKLEEWGERYHQEVGRNWLGAR